MCISCGVECFGRCGCNDTSTEDLLNELEKDFSKGLIDEDDIIDKVNDLLDVEDAKVYLESIGIDTSVTGYYFDDRDLNDNSIYS